MMMTTTIKNKHDNVIIAIIYDQYEYYRISAINHVDSGDHHNYDDDYDDDDEII